MDLVEKENVALFETCQQNGQLAAFSITGTLAVS